MAVKRVGRALDRFALQLGQVGNVALDSVVGDALRAAVAAQPHDAVIVDPGEPPRERHDGMRRDATYVDVEE